MRYLPIDQIQRSPYWPVRDRPRPAPDEVDEARRTGIFAPVTVRLARQALTALPSYELLDGEWIWAIAQEAEIHQVPAIVHERVSDAEARAYVEARYRRALPSDPITQAKAYAAAYAAEGGRAVRGALRQTAAKLGMTPARLKHYLNLLDLAPGVQDLVAAGRLAYTKARRLNVLAMSDQARLAERMVNEAWSARRLEHYLRGAQAEASLAHDANIGHLERVLTDATGTRVRFDNLDRDKGELVLTFYSLEQLEGLLERPLLDEATRKQVFD